MASKLFSELKRRNVLRVAALYLVSAWLTAQIADVVIGLGNLPAEIGRTVLIILALGFPVAVVLAWVFEWTPEGVRLETEAGEVADVPRSSGRRVDYVIISLLSVALLYFIATHDWSGPAPPSVASIAVLPFENRSAAADDVYFTDGVHDDLLTQLAKIGSLVVISRTSVMRYRDTRQTIPEIAAELGVANILEGGVQRAGDRVRINLQLIEAATDRHLWAETYDRELSAENVFEIQGEIATSIARVLHATLLPGEQRRIETIPTRNLDAYDSWLLGRRNLASRRPQELSLARDYFQRAVELDPAFALGYSGLSDALALLSAYSGRNPAELLSEADRAARKALELDPELGEAHTSFGVVRKFLGDPPEAYASYLAKGVELAPGSADARKWYANFLAESGRHQEALSQLQKAVELDPMSAIVRVNLADLLENLGYFDESTALYQRALEIEPQFQPGLFWADRARNRDESLLHFSRAYASGADDPLILLFLVLGYVELGDEDRAAQWLAVLERDAPGSVWIRVSHFNLSLFSGRQDEALELAAQLLPFESAYVPVPSRVLAVHDLRNGDPRAAVMRYEQKYPAILAADHVVSDDYSAATDIAMLLQAVNETEKAARLLDGSLAYFARQLDRGAPYPDLLFFKARTLALQANYEEALRTLDEAIAAGWTRHWWYFMKSDPAFDKLRQDPRFQQASERLAEAVARQLANVRKMEQNGEIVLPPGAN